MKKTFAICLLSVFLIAIVLRLYPTLISGMPFSTDSWPLIRNTELLIQNTPIPLNSSIFDGYNNFWPAIQIFSAALSNITSLPPITAMALGIPLVASLAIPLFYLLVKKITGNNRIALASALMLATAFSFTFFTSGVTKEAFASPIYIALILIFLQKHDLKIGLLFSATSLALALTHHLTAFFATLILAAISLALFINKTGNAKETNSNKSNILFTAIQAAITLVYIGLFASPSFNSTATSSNILTVGAYTVIGVTLTLCLVYTSKFSPKRQLLQFVLGSIIAIEVMFTVLNFCTLPGAHLLYALPLIIALPIAIFGLTELYKRNNSLLIPLFWLFSVLAFTGFSLFANSPGGSDFAWRSMNFLLPPLIILTAIGFYKLYTTPIHLAPIRKLTKTFAILAILSIASLNAYGMYATVSAQDPSLGYSWLYNPSDYKASYWLATNAQNQTTAGDITVDYLLHQYFNKSVSLTGGLKYLNGDGSAPEILYIYKEMYQPGKGFVYNGVPITLPDNWPDKLSNYNVVYANNEVTIYARR
jgi:hypothetical protein